VKFNDDVGNAKYLFQWRVTIDMVKRIALFVKSKLHDSFAVYSTMTEQEYGIITTYQMSV